ncbi:hypothetical protein [Halorhabdus rudnickae]|uniref:hypothetical protein n=1 Tax=Halorhabdus rudnickae TaxID=1775544 RepID=UPI0010835475|nr:hypothetical protein [Halorhabdus rudnickae]
MNRRSVIASLGGAITIGTSGCVHLNFLQNTHRLWFVRLNRAWEGTVEVDARIKRNGTVVHESSYEVPGIEESDKGDEEPMEWAGTSRKLIQSKWDTAPAVFTVESKLSDNDDWVTDSFSNVESTHIGATVDIVGPGVAGIKPHEFDSETEVQQFLDQVTPPNVEH